MHGNRRLQAVRTAASMAVAVMVTAFLVVWAVEGMQRQSLLAPVLWMREHPMGALLNVAVAAVLGLGLAALLGRLHPGLWLTAGVLLLLGLVDQYKQSLLGQPLFPWDLLLHRQAASLAPSVWHGLGLINAAVAALTALGLALLRWGLPVARLRWRTRVPSVLLMVALVGAFWTHPATSVRALGSAGIMHRYWEQAVNTRYNGLMLVFLMNLGSANVPAPSGYSRESVAQVLTKLPPGMDEAEERPNVIVVMSEAFSDPTTIPGIRFSEDPLPNLHRLRKEQSSGWLYSPVYGGGTANTEFEFLTGNTMSLLPEGSVPYQQYIKRPLPSLASVFSKRGYRTVALHTFHGWFWERRQVYQHLGFQRFLSSEDMPDAPLDGPYISDSVLTQGIIREHEAGGAPLFLFAVSMEGHGPYAAGRYPQTSIRAEGPLNDGLRAALEGYVEGLRHSDRELGALVDYFSRVKEPTIIVFFGDHLPLLTYVYGAAGVIKGPSGWTAEQRYFMHRVPLVVWRNFGPERTDLGELSPALLGPYLLELTGTPGTPYQEFLRALRSQVRVSMRGLVIDAKGKVYSSLPPSLKPLEQQWRLLQYDELFGDNYQSAMADHLRAADVSAQIQSPTTQPSSRN